MEDGGIEKGGVDMVEVDGLADGPEIFKFGRGHAVEIEEALRGGIGLRHRGASHGKGAENGGDDGEGSHVAKDSTDIVPGKWGDKTHAFAHSLALDRSGRELPGKTEMLKRGGMRLMGRRRIFRGFEFFVKETSF